MRSVTAISPSSARTDRGLGGGLERTRRREGAGGGDRSRQHGVRGGPQPPGRGIPPRRAHPLALGLKDIRLVPRTADQLGVPMPVAGVAYDHFPSAASRGRGGLDWTAVSEVVHEAAGLAPAWGSSTSDPVNVR